MSVVATIIGCFIMIVRKLTKSKLEPKCRYIIWVIFIISLIFPVAIPSKISVYNYIDVINIRDSKMINSDKVELSIENISEIEQYENCKIVENSICDNLNDNNIFFAIVIINICVVLAIIKLIVSICSYIIISYKEWNNVVNDDRVNKILNDCKEKLKIKKDIKIVKQNFTKVPSIVGIYNVKILFTDMTLKLSDNELTSIILHELSHYKRKDIIMNWIITFIKAFYCFNPVIGFLLKYMRIDMEIGADSLAVSKLENIDDTEYCKIIVKTAKICNRKREYVLGLVSGKAKLSDRIDAILNKKYYEVHHKLIVVFTAIVMLFMVFVLYPTSYGEYVNPKLELRLDNGEIIDVEKQNIINLPKNSRIKFLIDKDEYVKDVYYQESNIKTQIYYCYKINPSDEIYYESGEYVCKITLKCSSGKSLDYNIKILVE